MTSYQGIDMSSVIHTPALESRVHVGGRFTAYDSLLELENASRRGCLEPKVQKHRVLRMGPINPQHSGPPVRTLTTMSNDVTILPQWTLVITEDSSSTAHWKYA